MTKKALSCVSLAVAVLCLIVGLDTGWTAYTTANRLMSLARSREGSEIFHFAFNAVNASFLLSVSISLFLAFLLLRISGDEKADISGEKNK